MPITTNVMKIGITDAQLLAAGEHRFPNLACMNPVIRVELFRDGEQPHVLADAE